MNIFVAKRLCKTGSSQGFSTILSWTREVIVFISLFVITGLYFLLCCHSWCRPVEEGAGEWTAGSSGKGPAAALQAPSLIQERVRTSQQRP